MADLLLKTIDSLSKRIEALETQERSRFVGCRVYNNTSISVTNTIYTALTFNTESFDVGGLHSTGSNMTRITAPVSGKYLVGGHIYWAANGTGYRTLAIRVNGSTIKAMLRMSPISGFATYQSIATLVELDAAGYAELLALQTSGGNLNVGYGAASPHFWATLA